MALETATYISDLNSSNPQSTDTVSQADDHLRLIKSAIKATFPSVTGAVTKTHSQINDGLEKSGGVMTGTLTLSGAPSSDLHAATKAYVDTGVASKVAPTRQVATGTGLSGGGDLSADRTISIANGGVSTTQLADGGVTEAKIATGAVATAKIADGAVTPAKLSQKLTQGTAVASTSGTAIDFTGIPSWAKKITVALSAVSTNGAAGAALLIQAGTASGVENTGYVSSASVTSGSNSTGTISSTAGFISSTGLSASTAVSGVVVLVNVSGNTWVASGGLGASSAFFYGSGGTKTLGGTLDRIRITTTSTDAFDAGSINILYE